MFVSSRATAVKPTQMLPLAMAAGIAVSTTWNYFLNLDLTWKGHARPE